VGSQDSLLDITFRSSMAPVLCNPATPRPEGRANGEAPRHDAFSSSPGALGGSPLGRDPSCLHKLERFRFLPGPPGCPPGPPPPPHPPPLPPPPPPQQGRGESEHSVALCGTRRDCLDIERFRESGIASEYEDSNTDDSEEEEEELEEEEGAGMEVYGWGTDEETLRLLNVLNRQGVPDCLGDEIAI